MLHYGWKNIRGVECIEQYSNSKEPIHKTILENLQFYSHPSPKLIAAISFPTCKPADTGPAPSSENSVHTTHTPNKSTLGTQYRCIASPAKRPHFHLSWSVTLINTQRSSSQLHHSVEDKPVAHQTPSCLRCRRLPPPSQRWIFVRVQLFAEAPLGVLDGFEPPNRGFD